MNLLEKYLAEPGNYIIEAGGGYGKSTSLRYLAEMSFDKEISGKKELAIYIPMAEFNFKTPHPGMLLAYLKQFFSNEITGKALLEMIAESQERVHYLFLLDGFNEVHNYENNGQTVLDLLYDDILRLLEFANVNMILSTRVTELLPKKIKKQFQLLVLQPLSSEAVRQYLRLEDLTDIPGHVREMIKNPMLLSIFGKLYEHIPKQAILIDNKYQLFELYFKQDFQIHADEKHSDHLLKVRKYVIEKVLPFIAFRMVSHLFKQEQEQDRTKLLEEACLNSGYPEHVHIKLVKEVVDSLRILDSNFQFTHELYRDFFAAKGFAQACQEGREEALKFLEGLIDWLEYRNNQKELPRRTKFLDLADFIYSIYQANLWKALHSFDIYSKERILCLIERFYQWLSGVYDDLSNGEEAAKIGWIALEYLKHLESCFPPVSLADNYSFLYYSVKWDQKENEKCYEVIQHAKKILDEMSLSLQDQYYHDLYGKVLSNIGSYYYKSGLEQKALKNQEEADKMFIEAKNWHHQALEHRIKYCGEVLQARSYGTLMSDAYHLRNWELGYRYYCEAVRQLSPAMSLEENLLFGKETIPTDLVERALGSELEILKKGKQISLTEEILQNLSGQIQYIYENSTKPDRKNLKVLESLGKKLESLENCDLVKTDVKLLQLVEDYLKRCRSFY